MDLDEATVYTTETKHNSSLTPLYAILQAKDHEADRHHSDQLISDLIGDGNYPPWRQCLFPNEYVVHHVCFLSGN